jgi:hypothetical protein
MGNTQSHDPHAPRRHRPLPPRHVFLQRLAVQAFIALGVVAASLLLGACGYHFTAGLPWLDAVLNAAMILTGMGPVDPMKTAAAKVFATFYALFSGVVFLTMVAILLGPVLHRFLHRFHLELQPDEDDRSEHP